MKKRPRLLAPLRTVDFGNPDEKRAFNRTLFDTVAPRYDRVTRALSLGQDRRWKQTLVSGLPSLDAPCCLDLASGTGDISDLLRCRFTGARILGLDQNPGMLSRFRERFRAAPSVWGVMGDIGALPLPARSMDVVTAGYALRNAPDLDLALREIHRVLRPGGVLAVLDFSRPPAGLRGTLQAGVLAWWGRLFGSLYHGNGDVYEYIAASLSHYPDRPALTRRLDRHGLETARTRLAFGGILELRWATRRG